MPGENLDLTSDSGGVRPAKKPGRPFVGIRFACCDVYARIYVNPGGTAYQGNCPRCARRVELKIDASGSASRFFEAR